MPSRKYACPPLVATIMAMIALSACSDPKAATDANFRKALEPVVRDTFCRTIRIQRMSLNDDLAPPFPILVPAKRVEGSDLDDGQSRVMLEGAAHDGLLTRTEFTAPAKRDRYTAPLTRQALVGYTPTDKGKPYFRAIDARASIGILPFPAACAAKGEVLDIVRWTDPADMFGQTISRVTYTYKGVDPVAGLPDDIRTRITQPEERTATLVRANDGWRSM